MANTTRSAGIAIALVALVLLPAGIGYLQWRNAEIENDLISSFGALTHEQVQTCQSQGGTQVELLETHWLPITDFYAWTLCAMGERPFPQALPHTGVAMRLLVMPSFESPYMIRAQSFPVRFQLTAKWLSNSYAPTMIRENVQRPLSEAELSELTSRLGDLDFWDLPTPMQTVGVDGSMCLLEVVTHERYHAVIRWSAGELEPIVNALEELANLSIDWSCSY